MSKNCYLICLGAELDEFDGDLIISLRFFFIYNCRRTKIKWQIAIKIMSYISFDYM